MLQSKFRKALKGFSLIELLVAMVIIPTMILIVGQVYNTQFKTFLNQDALIQANTQNKIGLDFLTNQIQESAGVIFSCYDVNLCEATFTPFCPLFTSNVVLILNYWPIDPITKLAVEPTDAYHYDHIIYALKGDKLYQCVFPNLSDPNHFFFYTPTPTTRIRSNKLIAAKITSVNFSYNDSSPYTNTTKITVTLNSQANNGNRTFTSTNTSDVYLRNK